MNICIKTSFAKGRGVFVTRKFKKGEIIEKCPIIIISNKDKKFIDKTNLYNYYFQWGKNMAIALGYGSLYNHSYKPNATYKKNLSKRLITFIALKDIPKNKEITVNYNYGKPNDKTPVWFKITGKVAS